MVPASRFLLPGTDRVRGEMALPEEQPHVVGGQGETPCGRGARPPGFLPAWMRMQVKYEWGGMARDAGSEAKDAWGIRARQGPSTTEREACRAAGAAFLLRAGASCSSVGLYCK